MKPFAPSCIVPVDARPTRAITVVDASRHTASRHRSPGPHHMRPTVSVNVASMASGAILTS